MLQIMLKFKDGVDFQTYQLDAVPEYKDDISYVFVTEKGRALIDALNAFGDIPENIEATTTKTDITPDGSLTADAGSEETDGETE